MRLYRERRGAGFRVFMLEVHESVVEHLVDIGRLSEDQQDDKRAVSKALVELLASNIRDSGPGHGSFDLSERQIDILVRRGFLDRRARHAGNQVRKAFAEFVHEAFARSAKP